MANDDLKRSLESSVPRPVLIIGGSLLALSFSLNMVGIYVGPAINDWMEFKIEMAKSEFECSLKANKKMDSHWQRIEALEKRFETVEKLAHKKTE